MHFGQSHAEHWRLSEGLKAFPIGVTAKLNPVEVIGPLKAGEISTKLKVLILGMDGKQTTRQVVLDAVNRAAGKMVDVYGLPLVFPDGIPLKTEFPPEGVAYQTSQNPEAHYLWRWIGIEGFDLVLEIKVGEEETDPDSPLVASLRNHSPCNMGKVIGKVLKGPRDYLLQQIEKEIEKAGERQLQSESHAELLRRVSRKPVQIAELLSTRYGRSLPKVAYIPSLSLIARLRLSTLTNDPTHHEDVERIVKPWLTQNSLSSNPDGPNLAGHLLFGELAASSGPNARLLTELVRKAANIGFDKETVPLPAVPGHNEMSDSVFMVCPIMASAGRLTGEDRYYDVAARHFQFIRKLCYRKRDGIYRHSPLDEAAWGRGNGFVALGLALTLSDFQETHPSYGKLLSAYEEHLKALLIFQDHTGMWHQVIDQPSSYREFSGTCMIAIAILRGLRQGWLERETYEPAVMKAWSSICARISPDASLVDVCTGTGKQKDLQAYYNRTAILGHDDRGGAMAMMFATEMMADIKNESRK
ncbi:MAG: glycoside hydrolase family 88 protein [Planctomycetota bacterium]|nr:glycoside hydrolase family 88 protein [Planctomycetota bacterium]